MEEKANSGVFLRCPASESVHQISCYEVNIYDPNEGYPTASIIEVQRLLPELQSRAVS